MKPQIGFFSELQGPSLIINLAQLVSPSVALPADIVLTSKLYTVTKRRISPQRKLRSLLDFKLKLMK